MIKELIKDADNRMKGALQALEDDLVTIRTGRASPALIEKLQIEYYGMPTNLMQLATISVPEPRICSSARLIPPPSKRLNAVFWPPTWV